MNMTRLRGGNQAPHKFGLGFLLGASPTASKTSFVPSTCTFTRLPQDDQDSRAQFHLRKLNLHIRDFVGAAGRAATGFNAKIPGTRGTQMDAGGH